MPFKKKPPTTPPKPRPPRRPRVKVDAPPVAEEPPLKRPRTRAAKAAEAATAAVAPDTQTGIGALQPDAGPLNADVIPSVPDVGAVQIKGKTLSANSTQPLADATSLVAPASAVKVKRETLIANSTQLQRRDQKGKWRAGQIPQATAVQVKSETPISNSVQLPLPNDSESLSANSAQLPLLNNKGKGTADQIPEAGAAQVKSEISSANAAQLHFPDEADQSYASDDDLDSSEDDFGEVWQNFLLANRSEQHPTLPSTSAAVVQVSGSVELQQSTVEDDDENAQRAAALARMLAAERDRGGDPDDDDHPSYELDAAVNLNLAEAQGSEKTAQEAPSTNSTAAPPEAQALADEHRSVTAANVPSAMLPEAASHHGDVTNVASSKLNQSKSRDKGKAEKSSARKRARAPLSDTTDIEMAARKAHISKKAEKRRSRRLKALEFRQATQATSRVEQVPDASGIMIIIDTNIILAHLSFLKQLHSLLRPPIQILVPKAVLKELDMLKLQKDRDIEISVGPRIWKSEKMYMVAREATQWLLEVTAASRGVVIQRMDDEAPSQMKSRNADARILHFVIRLQKRAMHEGGTVVLLSNDNILRLSARSEGLLAFSTKDTRQNPRLLLQRIAPAIEPPPAVTANQPAPSNAPPLLPGRFGISTYNYSANQPTAATKALPAGYAASYWPVSDASSKSASVILGPDVELARYRGLVQSIGKCKGCGSEAGTTIKTTPTLTHHACAQCLAVICRGCWNLKTCDWECSTPYELRHCDSSNCCSAGRALMLFNVLTRLDAGFRGQKVFKISTRDKTQPKATQHEGDEALALQLEAIESLLQPLLHSTDSSPLHPSTSSMLLSSSLIEVLTWLLTSTPFHDWPLRLRLFKACLYVIQVIARSSHLHAILFSRLIKQTSDGIRSILESGGRISWTLQQQPNVQDSFQQDVTRLTLPIAFPDLLVKLFRQVIHYAIELGIETATTTNPDRQSELDMAELINLTLQVGDDFVQAAKLQRATLSKPIESDTDKVTLPTTPTQAKVHSLAVGDVNEPTKELDSTMQDAAVEIEVDGDSLDGQVTID